MQEPSAGELNSGGGARLRAKGAPRQRIERRGACGDQEGRTRRRKSSLSPAAKHETGLRGSAWEEVRSWECKRKIYPRTHSNNSAWLNV